MIELLMFAITAPFIYFLDYSEEAVDKFKQLNSCEIIVYEWKNSNVRVAECIKATPKSFTDTDWH